MIDYPFEAELPGGLIDCPFKAGLPGGLTDCPFKAGLPGSLIDCPFKAVLPGGVGYGVGKAVWMRGYQTVLYMSSSHAVSTCVEFNQIRLIYSHLINSENNTSVILSIMRTNFQIALQTLIDFPKGKSTLGFQSHGLHLSYVNEPKNSFFLCLPLMFPKNSLGFSRKSATPGFASVSKTLTSRQFSPTLVLLSL